MAACMPCELENVDEAAIVYRDETWGCEVANGYEVPGWYILRLRRHAEGWSGLTPQEASEFGVVSQRIATAIQEATGAPTVYFMSFGENYKHFHFLVITRPVDLDPAFKSAGILAKAAEGKDREAALAAAGEVRAALAR